MDYTGEPTPPELAGAGNGGGFGSYRKREDQYGHWRDPSGILRNALGEVVSPAAALTPRPIGPPQSAEHELAVQLLDAQFDNMTPEKEE